MSAATTEARPVAGAAAPRARDHVRWVRRPDRLLALVAATLAVVTVARLPAAWASGNALNHVSGAWLTLADDLARGTFYRPLHDPSLGFGGTRFFPLAFALHAGLVRLGAPLLPAGFALSALAGALVAGAAFALLRALGASRAASGVAAALTLGGFAGQHALAAIRGDLLAVGLELTGLALVASAFHGRFPRKLALAGAAFVLAFAAKPTALTAVAAAALVLAVRGERRAAARLVAGVGAGAAAVVLATNALSSGRFLELLEACAAGGAGPGDVLRSPFRLARLLAVEDRAGLALLGAAVAAGLLAIRGRAPAGTEPVARAADDPLLLPGAWLAAALAGAAVVFASPGTGVNHLVELEAASAVLLGAALGARGLVGAAARALAPAAAIAGVVMALSVAHADVTSSRLAEIRAVLAGAPGPLVSEDPLVPLVGGGVPLVEDPWMLRLAAERDPSVARPLLEALRARRPSAVVLFQDLAAPGADAWYARGNLGPPTVAEVRHGYRLARHIGRYFVYVPAGAPAPGAAPLVAGAPAARARPVPAGARPPARPPRTTTQPGRRPPL